jgi:hypothetical protein
MPTLRAVLVFIATLVIPAMLLLFGSMFFASLSLTVAIVEAWLGVLVVGSVVWWARRRRGP